MNSELQILKENIRNVSVPLDINQIKEFFQNKELFFLIDYTKSKIKGNMFLTYISNMDLPSDILLADLPKTEKFELTKIYLETRNINTASALKYATTQILLENRGVDTAEIFERPLFSKEECQEFISNNKELIEKWDTFIQSTMVYFLTSVEAIEEQHNFKSDFKLIDDPQYIGCNVVNLFSVPSFLELFFSKPPTKELHYFKQQFEEYMFKGKNFYHYFMVPQNSLYQAFNFLLTSDNSEKHLETLIKKV